MCNSWREELTIRSWELRVKVTHVDAPWINPVQPEVLNKETTFQ